MSHRGGRTVLAQLAELLTARGIAARYHPVPAARARGSGWVTLGPASGRHHSGGTVWYLRPGAVVGGQRLQQPHLVWGRHLEHRAPAADLAAAAEAIAADAAAHLADAGGVPAAKGVDA
jgi:hypothetical protein